MNIQENNALAPKARSHENYFLYFLRAFVAFWLLILCGSQSLSAKEIIVKQTIQVLPYDVSVRQYPRADRNDDPCALLKVRTQTRGLKFDSRLGITGEIEYKNGEYWIYLSYGERVLQIIHDESLRLDYSLPFPLESNEVYLLIVELSDSKPEEIPTGNLSVLSSPNETRGASIFVDGEDSHLTTPALLTLKEGIYTIAVEKELYEPTTQSVVVTARENKQIVIDLYLKESIKQYGKQLSTQKIISGTLSALALGTGIYCTLQGNKSYNNYNQAKEQEIIDLHKKQTKQYDTGAIVSYSVSLGSLAWFCSSLVKSNKTKNK